MPFSLSGLLWDEDRHPHLYARLSCNLGLRVDCDSRSLCDDAVETWSWYPTIELVWSYCDTVYLDTVSSDDMGPGVPQTKEKKKCMLWDYLNNICQGQWHIYVCCVTWNTYITNIHMLFENKVTYANVTPTYICCLKIKQHIIQSQWY